MVLPESSWVEIQPSAVEVDRIIEVVGVSEAAAFSFDGHDFAVESLGCAVVDLVRAVTHHVLDT
jgi:hypothetical protein